MRGLALITSAALLCLAACSSGGTSDAAPMADCCMKAAAGTPQECCKQK
jgi:hypothetical protein